MKVAINSTDALACYRTGVCDRAATRTRVFLPRDFVPQISMADALRLHDRCGTQIPLRVVVQNLACRRKSQLLQCSVMGDASAIAGFIKLRDDCFMVSPELCALGLAQEKSLIELVAVITELCGGFSLANDIGEHYRQRIPLSSIASIAALLEESAVRRGRTVLQKACRLAVEDAYSPMEAILAILLKAPAKLGGYGLGDLLLNAAVCRYADADAVKGTAGNANVSLAESSLPSFVRTGHPAPGVLYADLVFPLQRVVVEYLSKEYHEGRWLDDAARSNRLQDAGFGVISVTPAQVFDVESMHTVAAQIARMLKKKPLAMTTDWVEVNARLRDELFSAFHTTHSA